MDYWLGQLAAGKTTEDIIATYFGSEEYYQQHSLILKWWSAPALLGSTYIWQALVER